MGKYLNFLQKGCWVTLSPKKSYKKKKKRVRIFFLNLGLWNSRTLWCQEQEVLHVFFRYMSYRISFLYCTRNKYREGPRMMMMMMMMPASAVADTTLSLFFFCGCISHLSVTSIENCECFFFFCSWCCGQMIHTQTAVEILKRGPFFYSM